MQVHMHVFDRKSNCGLTNKALKADMSPVIQVKIPEDRQMSSITCEFAL